MLVVQHNNGLHSIAVFYFSFIFVLFSFTVIFVASDKDFLLLLHNSVVTEIFSDLLLEYSTSSRRRFEAAGGIGTGACLIPQSPSETRNRSKILRIPGDPLRGLSVAVLLRSQTVLLFDASTTDGVTDTETPHNIGVPEVAQGIRISNSWIRSPVSVKVSWKLINRSLILSRNYSRISY